MNEPRPNVLRDSSEPNLLGELGGAGSWNRGDAPLEAGFRSGRAALRGAAIALLVAGLLMVAFAAVSIEERSPCEVVDDLLAEPEHE